MLTVVTSAGCKADIGDPCTAAEDCEFGLVCAVADAGPTVCQLQPPVTDMQPVDMGMPDGDL